MAELEYRSTTCPLAAVSGLGRLLNSSSKLGHMIYFDILMEAYQPSFPTFDSKLICEARNLYMTGIDVFYWSSYSLPF